MKLIPNCSEYIARLTMTDGEKKEAKRWIAEHLTDKGDIDCMNGYLNETGNFAFTQEELAKPYEMLTKHILYIRKYDKGIREIITESYADMARGKRTVVFTNGCFDIIHPGHIAVLKKAKSLGDYLIVGLNSDSSVRQFKPGRPINDQETRKKVLESIRYVDKVVIFNEPSPAELIKRLKPDVLVKGSDYKLNQICGRQYVKKVVRVSLKSGYSTTNIIDKILKLGKKVNVRYDHTTGKKVQARHK
jgi:rfaE bifunctional protein nucleotidyltransferase chain/domain